MQVMDIGLQMQLLLASYSSSACMRGMCSRALVINILHSYMYRIYSNMGAAKK